MEHPDLPPGRSLELPGRGTTFVREVAGPPGAPTLLLLHGWTVTADLNFYGAYAALGRRFRVVATDHRGHGRGLRADTPFTLEDAADDAAAVARALDIDRCIAVGYSMGGAVAQLLWRRHPDLLDGLVLCATAAVFNERREEAIRFLGLTGLATVARAAPDTAKKWVADQFLSRKGRHYEDWALDELSRHDLAAQLEAGAAIGRFSSVDWLADIDVPTSVVVTTEDQVVPMRRQVQLFESIPGAQAYRVDGPHDAIASMSDQYVPTLIAAATSVAERSRKSADPDVVVPPPKLAVRRAGAAASAGPAPERWADHRSKKASKHPAEKLAENLIESPAENPIGAAGDPAAGLAGHEPKKSTRLSSRTPQGSRKRADR